MTNYAVEMYCQHKDGGTGLDYKGKAPHIEAGLPTPTFSHGGFETKKKGQ